MNKLLIEAKNEEIERLQRELKITEKYLGEVLMRGDEMIIRAEVAEKSLGLAVKALEIYAADNFELAQVALAKIKELKDMGTAASGCVK